MPPGWTMQDGPSGVSPRSCLGTKIARQAVAPPQPPGCNCRGGPCTGWTMQDGPRGVPGYCQKN